MKKFIIILFLLFPLSARADLFGGDVVVLAQILTQNVKQLLELQKILSNGKDNLELVQEINRGINDSLKLIRTISPYVNPGAYDKLKNIEDILKRFNIVFGKACGFSHALSQKSVDAAVAEAVMMNNSIYDYTAEIDKIGEDIKSYSHEVSLGVPRSSPLNL